MEPRAARVGKNEALFREVNERIREITTYDSDIEFLCECGDPGCARPILMTIGEYEDVRTNAKRFVVVPGHEASEVETVVETTDRFTIVEKHPGTPTELAVQTDPRA
jgi:hypothetical protein